MPKDFLLFCKIFFLFGLDYTMGKTRKHFLLNIFRNMNELFEIIYHVNGASGSESVSFFID
jgi:hypothetical protein